MTTQRIIGLTGGIATGKSTVTTYLTQRYQLPIFDADIFVRQAIAKMQNNHHIDFFLGD
ncbi:dephospho-CoA kinase [[Synechococcus] sp. NIES-970]|nr:dephospho-CoA kinase [[Synechococcus] sp. NIES-970]